MSDNTSNFVDPLDNILDRVQKNSSNGDEIVGGIKVPPMPNSIKLPPDEEERVTVKKADPEDVEINYGDDDLDNEIRELDLNEAMEKQRQLAEAAKAREENKPTAMPPESYDQEAIDVEVAHQENAIGIVAQMVQQVAVDFKLPSGGIPPINPMNKKDENFKMRIMGDLLECYHRKGAVITETFRDTVLDNWYLDSGITARAYVNNGFKEYVEPVVENNPDNGDVKAKEVDIPNPTININVEPGTPVTVNVDESIVGEMKTPQKVVDIFVKEVSQKDLLVGNIVTNSDLEGIIQPFDPGLEDTPVTLPTSGYRCVLRPLSWFNIVSLLAPTGKNIIDVMTRQWSIIFKSLKWTSVGKFKDFDDFCKHTRFIDLNFFMYAILVSTSAEEEDITFTCGNENCEFSLPSKYRPREIIHINEDMIPSYYEAADKAAPGPEAVAILNSIVSSHKGYELPDTKTIVEINAPTIHDFISVRFTRMRELYERFYPDGNFDKALPHILSNFQQGLYNEGGEFAIYLGAAMLIDAVYVKKGNTYYKYTVWKDIEAVLTDQLSFQDSYLLFNEIFPNSKMFESPVSFWIEGYTCPKCGRHNTRVPIDDIGESLLFLLSQRYQNTKINLKELPAKS